MPYDLNTVSIILLFVCLVFSAFFSSAEAVFISLQKIRIMNMVSKEVPGAKLVFHMVEHPDKLLATVLLANNFVNTAAAALGTVVAVSYLGRGRGSLVAIVGVTILLLVFGEVVPKSLGIRHGERLALIYARPLQFVEWILFPLARLLRWMSQAVVHPFGGKAPTSLVSEDEIRTVISMGTESGALEMGEAEMMHKVLEFGERRVKEVVTPRPQIIWVEAGTKFCDFLKIYSEHSHTRFPVYEGSVDNVIGVLWVKDVLLAIASEGLKEEDPVTRFLRPATFVPESKPVGDLFDEMRASGNTVVLVVDEFGGISGLATLTQLLEEIVGPVSEKALEEEFEAIDEKTFQVDGEMRVEEANEKLGLDLPKGDYETVAGFMLNVLGRIPREGEELKIEGLRLVVTRVKGVKIEKVLVTKG